MKLCRFDDDRLGVVLDGAVHDVSSMRDEMIAGMGYAAKADPVIAALPAWRGRLEALAPQSPSKPLAEARLLSPVGRPPKIMAAPTNYRAHIAEMQADKQAAPVKRSTDIGEAGIFLKASSSLVGPSEGVPIRFLDRRNDHEVELVAVIGREGSDIAFEDALDHVAGYSIGLDMTLRGPEDRSFRKSIDGYSVLGPCMVTADEIADPDNVRFSVSVNGEIRQDANTSDMVYSTRRLIEFASSFYTLYPGDLLYTGSPEGVGPVKPGDLMRAECAPIGAMEVEVRAH